MKKLLLSAAALLFGLLPISISLAVPVDDSYVLRPNDVIALSVYEEPDLSSEVRILKTGQASFPLIGSVDVAGQKVAAVATKLRDLYAQDYLVDPKLTVTVREYATDFISVIGAVATPGQIPIPVSGDLDLGSALASAGGVTENADTRNIQLVRASGSTSSYNLASIQGASGRVKLQSGDRIIVNQSAFVGRSVTILGCVKTPGSVAFPVNGQLDLVTAIAKAGGLTDLANPRKITINRKGQITVVNFREISQQSGKQLNLLPDDIITVAERLF